MFTINATINGVQIPVQVTDEEMNTVVQTCYPQNGTESLRQAIMERVVYGIMKDEELTEEQLEDNVYGSFEWEEEFAEYLEMDNEEFAEKLMNLTLENDLARIIKDKVMKEKYYEFEVLVHRVRTEKQRVTVCVKAESEDKARDYFYDNIGYCDLESCIDNYNWDYDDEENMVDDWAVIGESDTADYPCLND